MLKAMRGAIGVRTNKKRRAGRKRSVWVLSPRADFDHKGRAFRAGGEVKSDEELQ